MWWECSRVKSGKVRASGPFAQVKKALSLGQVGEVLLVVQRCVTKGALLGSVDAVARLLVERPGADVAVLLIGALAAIGLQPAARAGWAGGSIRMDLSLTRDHELQRARDAVAHAAAQLVLNEHPSEYTSASSELTTAQRHEAASQRHEAASQLMSQLTSTPSSIPNASTRIERARGRSDGVPAACVTV